MKRRLKVPEHEKPNKPKYVPPKIRKLPIVALAAALVLSQVPRAEARPSLREFSPGNLPAAAETVKPFERIGTTSSGEHDLSENAPNLAAESVSTTVEYMRQEDGQNMLSLNYSDASGRSGGVSIPIREDMGELTQKIPGTERTVLIFENSIIVTIGFEASFRGEIFLRMDGGFRNGSGVEFPLPADCRDGNLRSATVTTDRDGNESALFFINKAGHVRATRIDQWNIPYSAAQLQSSETAVLSGTTGDIAMHFEPGSGKVTFLKADFSAETISTKELQLPAPTQSTPLLSRRGGELVLTVNGTSFTVAETEPGNFSSLQLIRLP